MLEVNWWLIVNLSLLTLLVGINGFNTELISSNNNQLYTGCDCITSNYQRDSNETLQESDALPLCSKLDQHFWQFRYFDEASSTTFKPKICDKTLDMRLANQVYSVNMAKLINDNRYSIDTGEAELDKTLEQQIVGAKVNDKLCAMHLEAIVEQLRDIERQVESRRKDFTSCNSTLEEQHIRLARVLDSFGRYDSGLQSGRTSFLGDYKQCLNTNLLLNNQLVGSRYCVAKMSLMTNLENSLKHRKLLEYESSAQLFFGICLPESCHITNLSPPNLKLVKVLINSQISLPRALFLEDKLELDSVYCQPDQDSQWALLPFAGKLLLILLVGWTALVILFSLKNQQATLSINQSIDDFLEPAKQRVSRVHLDVLNPIKVSGAAFVVFCHATLTQLSNANDILRAYKMLEEHPLFYALGAGTNIVDTFFTLTGILITYISLKKLNLKRSAKQNGCPSSHQFIKYTIAIASSRYLRLLPMYLLVFWFKKSMFARLGRGPLWDFGLNKHTYIGGCDQLDSYYTPFILNAGYQPFQTRCLAASWSIACDICFCAVAAPIIVLLSQNNRSNKFATSLSVGICVVSSCWAYWQYDYLPEAVRENFEDVRVRSISVMFRGLSVFYTAPHVRAATFFIGVLAGQFLYSYDTGSDGKWPYWLTGIGTKLSVFVVLATPTLPALIPFFRPILLDSFPISLGRLFALAHGFGRLYWGTANAILFLRMITDWSSNSWLIGASHRFWRTTAKLNFIILLVHMDILAYEAYLQTATSPFSFHKTYTTFASCYLFCLIIAVPLHLIVENPIDKLIKKLMNSNKHQEVDKNSNGGMNSLLTSTGNKSKDDNNNNLKLKQL